MAKLIEVTHSYNVCLDTIDIQFLGKIVKTLSDCNKIDEVTELRKFIFNITGQTLILPRTTTGKQRGPYKKKDKSDTSL